MSKALTQDFQHPIKVIDKVKYPGVIFDPKLSFKLHLEDRMKKTTMIFLFFYLFS
jgi:hypothetical protein